MIFVSKAEKYSHNITDGENVQAHHAALVSPNGLEPGVVIKTGYNIRFVLRADHAIDLCNQIADALETHPDRSAAA